MNTYVFESMFGKPVVVKANTLAEAEAYVQHYYAGWDFDFVYKK